MSVRENDPVKRAHLHAIRALVMVIDKALALATVTAIEVGINPQPFRKIQEDLSAVMEDLVERLRTN